MGRRAATRGFLVIAVVASLALAWFVTHRAAAPEERLAIASIHQPATGLVHFARASGCLAEERLVLEEREFELGRDALVPLGDGSADVAVAFETPALRAAFGDPRVRILTALHRSGENTRLVARGDRGIEGVADLRGRRVGVTLGTNLEVFLDALLRFGSVREDEVTIVDLSPAEAEAGLARGSIDAAALFDPRASRVEAALGAGARVLHSELYLETSLLLTRDDVVEARRPALERLVRALACAERRAAEGPEHVVAALLGDYPGSAEELRRQLARARWGLGLDHVLLDLLRRQREWLEGQGLQGAPDLSRLIEPRVLEAVAPGAVLLLPLG